MTNFEFHKDELLKIANDGEDVAIFKEKPCKCGDIDCDHCDFGRDCGAELIKWLYAEHVEKPKINKRTKMFFDAIETGWVARDGDGALYLFAAIEKPAKQCATWRCNNLDRTSRIGYHVYPFLTLDFIKWEDEEPWSVEDIRNLEVV